MKFAGILQFIFALFLSLLSSATLAAESSWPSRPVRIIVPFPPGQGADIIARLLAQRFSTVFGQPFIVENRPGAGSMIGTTMAARAPADGYTLLMGGTSALVINPALYEKLDYDTLRDFAPISNVAALPMLIMVSNSLPINSISELIKYAKAHPGKLTYGSAGIGSAHHLIVAKLARMADVQLTHVPYKGSAAPMTDLMSGRIDILADTLPAAVPSVKAGKVKALAVSSLERSRYIPDLPTLDESGIPGFDAVAWSGLLAPRKTPPEILERLSAATKEGLAMPDVQERFKQLSMQIIGNTPIEFENFIKLELDRWRTEVKAADVKVE
jgi:tripartite-type tricarboxylate transporter receptor subunit TctC